MIDKEYINKLCEEIKMSAQRMCIRGGDGVAQFNLNQVANIIKLASGIQEYNPKEECTDVN